MSLSPIVRSVDGKGTVEKFGAGERAQAVSQMAALSEPMASHEQMQHRSAWPPGNGPGQTTRAHGTRARWQHFGLVLLDRPLEGAEGPLRALGGPLPRQARAVPGLPPAGMPFEYWRRPLVLTALALLVLGLTWRESRLAPRPALSRGPEARTTRGPTGEDQLGAATTGGSAQATVPLLTVVDERFVNNQRMWPNDPQSTAWVTDGAYRLFAREPARFVAVSSPVMGRLQNIVVTGTFRKIGGPPGGSYGLVVRDEGPGPRDGINQGGRFYVFEGGDRGEVSIRRRDEDHWVDILPRTGSEIVHRGGATNELSVQAIGPRLTFWVNGIHVASHLDATLRAGQPAVFVDGDFNEVVLSRFTVQVPT